MPKSYAVRSIDALGTVISGGATGAAAASLAAAPLAAVAVLPGAASPVLLSSTTLMSQGASRIRTVAIPMPSPTPTIIINVEIIVVRMHLFYLVRPFDATEENHSLRLACRAHQQAA